MFFCGCAICSGGGLSSDSGFTASEPLGNTGPKPTFDWDRAGQQIFRTIGDWMPSYPSPLTLTYAYRVTANAPPPPPGATDWIGGLGKDMGGFQQFTAAQIDSMELAVRLIQDVANIKLVRVGDGNSGSAAYSDNAQILMGNYTSGTALQALGFGFYTFNFNEQGQYARAGSVWNNGTRDTGITPTLENGGMLLNIHELLHAIGANHPGDYNVGQGGPIEYATGAVYAQDTYQYSLMSYFPETNGPTGANYGSVLPHTPMMHDIAGLQRIYGANMSTRTGDTIYGFGSNTGLDSYTLTSAASQRIFTIWDAGGNDTLNFSQFTTGTTINLNPETFSSGGSRADGGAMLQNIAIARGVMIENAVGGSGNDTIIGNSGRNTITPGAGNDSVDGGAGIDTAVINATRSQAQVTVSGATITVTMGSEIDSFTNLERFRYSDAIVAFDLDGHAGQAYRLYQAAFARTPDLGGVSFWTNRIDGGTNLIDVAAGFVASQEFRTVYGTSATNSDIVSKFYQNVLNRAGEPGGINFWVGELNSGARSVSQVLGGFSESAENKQLVGVVIANGILLDPTAFV